MKEGRDDAGRVFDGERWRLVSPHLDRALDLEGEERAAWLAGLRAQDPLLAAEVEALLQEHDRLSREGFLEKEPGPGLRRGSLEGHVIGAYRLRSLIGQGGMGGVWLADRCDGRFEGVAAVKLLNASLAGPEGVARFVREGSILARLRHPHIAHLIDAGLSASGQPYLVLEHVDGDRIDTHCDARRLDTASRIRLFLDVLGAVAHAHANLIVHRDLKPQNVLVSKDGRVKLLDFGIAKLLEPEPGSGLAAGVTREGATALTLEYAAPEQLTGGGVTTATDVYALGVVLYELLTGRHPAGTLGSSPAEIIHAILDAESVRASVAIRAGARQAGETPEAVAARRGTTPRRLEADLRGDLDNILARALRKAPSERYASVQAMAEDLRRHLAHEPVSARAVTFAYRCAKFVRRNRGGVAAGLLVGAALVAGAGGIAWQELEVRRQRDAARTELARANATNEFMGFLLSVAAPPGQKFDVVDLLDRGEGLIDRQFSANDSLRAEMLAAIARQYILTERWDRAGPVLERAAELAERSGDPALRARVLCPLANLYAGTGESARGKTMMNRALRDLPDDPMYGLQRAECLIWFADFGYFTDEAEPTIRHASEAIALLDADPSLSTQKRAEAQAILAYGYYLDRQYAKADESYAELMDVLERSGLGRTIAAADALNNWSLVHFLGDIRRAESLARRCVDLRRSIEGPGSVTPTSTFNLAGALFALARYPEARDLLEETIRTAALRHEERIELDATMELAALRIETGDLERAASLLAKVSGQVTGQALTPGRQRQLLYYRGRLALARDDAAQARQHLAEAVRRFEEAKAKFAMSVMALIHLARAERALDHADAAMDAASRAVSLAETLVEPEAPSYLVGLSLALRGDLELAAGRREEAGASLRRALEHLEETLGADHPATREALTSLSLSSS